MRRNHSFELFGFDFMIDEDFRIYLIEANTNPCFDTSCPLLARIIGNVIDTSFKIALDPVFCPLEQTTKKNLGGEIPTEIKMELVFDEAVEGPELGKVIY
jgi:hypothetical protein